MNKKVFCIFLAIIIVIAVVPTFASAEETPSSAYFSGWVVHGDDSQNMVTAARQEPNSMDVKCTYIDDSNDSTNSGGFKFRGYNAATGTACTYAKLITLNHYTKATYLSSPSTATLKMSITSPYYSDYYICSGLYRI